MPDDFVAVQVNQYDTWGKLVMSWSTTKDFVNGDGSSGFKFPLPAANYSDGTVIQMTTDEFKARVAQISGGLTIVFPPLVKELIFVRDSETRRYVRLPDPNMIQNAYEQFKVNGANYSVPPFYITAPFNPNPGAPLSNAADKLTFQADRVGDYSIGSCA
ncbi:MAG TPA: hypothetical protein VGG99_10495 [Acetobacteraceae bacterium]|jgi:hypothetical protein